MENKRQTKRQDAKVSEKPSQVVSLADFIDKSVREGKLKPWQRKEIETFFVIDLKLKVKEEPQVYEDALGKF